MGDGEGNRSGCQVVEWILIVMVLWKGGEEEKNVQSVEYFSQMASVFLTHSMQDNLCF